MNRSKRRFTVIAAVAVAILALGVITLTPARSQESPERTTHRPGFGQ